MDRNCCFYKQVFYLFKKFTLTVSRDMWDLSSLMRDWTCDPCSGSMKSFLWIAKEVWHLLTRIWLSQNCAFFRHLSQWPLPMGLVLASLTNVPLGCGTCSSLRMADAGSACPWSLCLLGLCGSPKCREHEGRRARGGHAKKDRGSRVTLSPTGLQSPDLWGACTVNTQVSCVVTCRGGGVSGWGWDRTGLGLRRLLGDLKEFCAFCGPCFCHL